MIATLDVTYFGLSVPKRRAHRGQCSHGGNAPGTRVLNVNSAQPERPEISACADELSIEYVHISAKEFG